MESSKKTLTNYLYRIGRKYDQLSGKTFIHFIHIGKTGGSAVKYALEPYQRYGSYIFIPHSHSFKLMDAQPGEKVIFFLRDPIKRYMSAFYSRQRKGLPHKFYEWTADEEIAFGNFSDPDQLAQSLSSADPDERQRAIHAMNSIHHVNSHYMNWFLSQEYFLSRAADIFHIGFLETLEKDFEFIKKKMRLPEEACLPADPATMHKNPLPPVPLSSQAIENLKSWYKEDYEFIDFCHRFLSEKVSE